MKIALLAVALGFHTQAFASFVTGNKLLADLAGQQDFGEAFAFGYVIGVFDSYEAATHCVTDDGITQGQAKRIARKYLEEHPEDLHEPADRLLLKAFRNAFPCPSDRP